MIYYLFLYIKYIKKFFPSKEKTLSQYPIVCMYSLFNIAYFQTFVIITLEMETDSIYTTKTEKLFPNIFTCIGMCLFYI